MKRGLAVTVLMDEACVAGDGFRRLCEESATEFHVVNALRHLGFTVRVVGVGGKLEPIIADLAGHPPHLVFNLTEQYRDQRRLDTNVAGLLELLDIPFTGSGSTGLLLCRNKDLCKHLLRTRRIGVPGFAVLPPGRKTRPPRGLRYPLIVKPLYEDGSDGISNSSLVTCEADLVQRVRMVHERFNEPAIAEEYIEGRELYIGIIGNRRLRVLPPRELHFGAPDGSGPVIATYRVKWNKEYQKKWNVSFGFCDLPRPLLDNITRVCRRAYRLLHLHDYARIDLRVTPDNRVVIFEVNPNPGLDKEDEIAMSAGKAGIPYTRLIENIVRQALSRDAHSRGGRAKGDRSNGRGAERGNRDSQAAGMPSMRSARASRYRASPPEILSASPASRHTSGLSMHR